MAESHPTDRPTESDAFKERKERERNIATYAYTNSRQKAHGKQKHRIYE